jgi:hypothetical protein
MKNLDALSLKGRMTVEFTGEEGRDAGGLTREWYTILSREIFNPNYALFKPSANGVTFQPSPQSGVNHDHLSYFKFVGNIIGKVKILKFHYIYIMNFLINLYYNLKQF